MGQPYLLHPLSTFQPKVEKLASKFSFADNEDVVLAHLEVPGRWEVTDGRRELPYGHPRLTFTAPISHSDPRPLRLLPL